MMFHSLYLLIVFMAFAGNEHDIARPGKLDGGTYGFAPVDDNQCLAALCGVEAGKRSNPADLKGERSETDG